MTIAIALIVMGVLLLGIATWHENIDPPTLIALAVAFTLIGAGARHLVDVSDGHVLHCVTYINQAGDFIKKVCTP